MEMSNSCNSNFFSHLRAYIIVIHDVYLSAGRNCFVPTLRLPKENGNEPETSTLLFSLSTSHRILPAVDEDFKLRLAGIKYVVVIYLEIKKY
jgi:hypothetical protein